MPHHFAGINGPHAKGFGFEPFDPQGRRARTHGRREGRRDMRTRAQRGGLGFGPDFGPTAPRAGRGGHRGRGRGRRGDVRVAILALLAERPMHGYEMIQEIAARSNGLWRPSPGSVYPTLQMLVDEGLIVATEPDGNKRLFELTDEGRAAAARTETPPWKEITEGADPVVVNLRTAFGQLAAAVFQGAQAATPEQQKRIVDIVNAARRDVYGVLGETE